MEKQGIFRLPGGDKTPFIELDPAGVIRMGGKSFSEDASKVYNVVKDWVRRYIESPQPRTTLELGYLYFNTLSAKYVMDVIDLLLTVERQKKGAVRVVWRSKADDEEMKEAGETFSEILDHSFEFEPL